ncbi:hypothetical protein LSUE1_G005424 [Lachnellula suecica]|uniref:dihydroneopterin aldolase n=1 Tax=Lachnellula suecica TaxID=602035 RepID=A0A8T9C376_9HELO|nr:hypothetical protein LSUE1_G005424 [Lachnellula suecica]
MGVNTAHAWDLLQAAGKPHSVIRVRNLQTSLVVGKDAWGRTKKSQPVLISASVSLREPFESASTEDAVTKSTVHYGTLSKAILEACSRFSQVYGEDEQSLAALAVDIAAGLTQGQNIKSPEVPLLSSKMMRLLEITIMLPKASLLGSGVSVTDSLMYDLSEQGPGLASYILTLHDLKVTTLIGVNPNERLAKQLVVATVKIDGMKHTLTATDSYNALEEIVVKTIEESSFQTLEALAAHVGMRIIKYFLIPLYVSQSSATKDYQITMSFEKPTAVTFADAPVVEMTLESDPSKNPAAKILWDSASKMQKPPFPLQGRLDEWIASNDS